MRVKQKTGREGGGFIALPWVVLDSPAYQKLSYPAKALLFEIARQYCRDNNGRLLCSRNYLKSRGWTSSSVIQRAKDELLAAGFIFETVKGHRPNKASWYAVTWYTLDKIPGYEHGVEKAFVRGAYRKNDQLIPHHGTARASLAPADGTGKEPTVSLSGAMRQSFEDMPAPPGEHHLEKPSKDFHLSLGHTGACKLVPERIEAQRKSVANTLLVTQIRGLRALPISYRPVPRSETNRFHYKLSGKVARVATPRGINKL